MLKEDSHRTGTVVLKSVQSVNVEQNLNQLNIFCCVARNMRKHGTVYRLSKSTKK